MWVEMLISMQGAFSYILIMEAVDVTIISRVAQGS